MSPVNHHIEDAEHEVSPAENGNGPTSRKRSTRACDGCKEKRLKCEDLRVDEEAGRETCKLCREGGEDCTFTAPVRKRGPVPGSTRAPKRSRTDDAAPPDSTIRTSRPKVTSPVATVTPAKRKIAPELPREPFLRDAGSRTISPPILATASGSRPSGRPPLLGLPRSMVDDLLAVYFTHVHNVWPLIYKPLFDIHTTSAPLLLAMISLAACVEPSIAHEGIDGAKLFAMAERSLHHCRMESRLDIVQSMILMSLRQTGCGDKGSAFLYAGRACTMALNLGLNLAPRPGSSDTEAEIESRSRTFWNAYVLDKTLSEETGRSFLLPYRRCSTPFPSLSETDEFETWPPLTMTSAPVPRSVRHIVPRRGYVLSCFTWTIRLGMIVEDILDLEVIGPPIVEPFDQQFADRRKTMRDPVSEAEGIADQLRQWRQSLPKHLEVDSSSAVSPLPHHIVGLSWWATASIQLYSRFMHRRAPHSSPVMSRDAMSSRAHQVCSESSRAVVDMLHHLERHGLLHQLSSDVIHILSLATLFQAFDSSDPDPSISQTAKADFERCCRWLKEFSGSWSAASSHKLFLEAVIQGGSSLAENQGKGTPIISDSPSNAVSSSLPEGLQVVRRNLSVAETTPTTSGPSAMLQLPGLYWNHLNLPAGPMTFDPSSFINPFDVNLNTPQVVQPSPVNGQQYAWQPQTSTAAELESGASDATRALDSILGEASTDTLDWSMFDLPFNTATPTNQPPPDQSAIQAALMSFMANAAKGR